MIQLSVNKFRSNLKSFVDQSINDHIPSTSSSKSWKRFYSTQCRGLGKPEPLKHNLKGLWSRRISQKERLIYRFDQKYIYIFAIGVHYDAH